ncbi:MAG: hypothetical protein HRT58_11865 [Crocinitomicaceae bacterium]|nr:hypothetical protein [Flavobacteriales bacterium]NQZ36356.1 hypothetical protein [Crocinitomicaceae bacterium]
MINDLYSDFDISPTVIRPEGLWYTNALTIDSYWLNERMIISAGFNSLRVKYVKDSINSPIATGVYYGQETVTRTFVFPRIEIAYRHPLGEHLYLQSYISFGAPEFMSRYKSRGISYTQEGQDSWDKYNTIRGSGDWDIYVDKKALFVELGQQLSYDIDRWSVSAGFNYFFFRNRSFEGYHGLHLNVGCSVRFGDKDINQKLESND